MISRAEVDKLPSVRADGLRLVWLRLAAVSEPHRREERRREATADRERSACHGISSRRCKDDRRP